MKFANRIIRGIALLICMSASATAFAGISVSNVSLNPSTISPGDSIEVTINVTTTGGGSSNDWESTRYTLDGVNYCYSASDGHTAFTSAGSHTEVFTIPGSNTAALANDTAHTVSFRAYRHGNCNGGSDTETTSLTTSSGGGGGGGGSTGTSCTAIFPVGVQSNSNSGEVKTESGVQINGSGSQIVTTDLSQNNGSCDGGSCSESNSYAESSSPSIKTGNGSDGDIGGSGTYGSSGDDQFNKLDAGGNITFSSAQDEYFFQDIWNLQDGANLTLAPGDYWIEGSATLNVGVDLVVSPAGTVRIYSKGEFKIGKNSDINTGGDASQLLIFSETKITIEEDVEIEGYLYSEGDFTIGERTEITGAVSASGTLDMKVNSKIDFESPTTGDFGDFCSSTVVVPDPVGFWQMDETSWSSSPGQVVDSSGNGHDGQAFNGLSTDNTAAAIPGDPGTCSYAEFTSGSGHYAQIPHNSALNGTNELTYVAWIRPDSWSGVRQVMAKSVHGGGSGRAQMGIFSESGNLRGRVETSGGRRNLDSTLPPTDGTWTHIALVFDGSSLTFYHDGVQVSSTSFSSTTLNQTTDALNIGKRVGTNQYLFDGGIDEVGVYTAALNGSQITAIMNQTRPCSGVATVDHYAISFTGGSNFNNSTGLTCEASSVTIIAHDASDAVLAPGNSVQISLSTSTGKGVWSSPDVGTLSNIGNNDGTATYTFGLTNHMVTLKLNHTDVATGAGAVNINTGSDKAAEDPDIEFFNSGFRFVDASDNPIGIAPAQFTQIAATNSATFFLQAVRSDDDSDTCVGAFPDGGDKLIDLGAECNNPNTCQEDDLVITNNGTSHDVPISDDNGGSGAASYISDRSIRFGADSKAALVLNYVDVGAISLHARHDILLESGSDSGVDLSGSSDPFVVKPEDLVIDVSGNPGTSSAGNGFKAAGENFTVRVEARNSAGSITPNFGRETTPEKVRLNFSALTFPTSGSPSNGSLSGVAENHFSLTATAGILESTTASWDEVGSFTAFASADGDYLGAGDIIGTVSGNIGRFYPDHFTLSGDSVSNSCGSFSYFEQPAITVGYTIRAEKVGGGITTNYDGPTFGFPVASVAGVAEDNNDGVELNSRLTLAASNWVSGSYVVSDTAAQIDRSTGALDAEMTALRLGLQIDDSLDSRDFDSLDMNAITVGNCSPSSCDARQLSGSLVMRFGRLFIQDTHGPESSPLPVTFQTEYWTGSQWLLNTDDSCSSFARSNVDFDGADVVSDFDVTVGGGTAMGTFFSTDATNINLVSGDAGLAFSGPGVGNTGSFPVDVDITAMPWLQFDWDQDGSHDDNVPTATINFGSYRGHDRVIYWQERLAD